MTGTDSYGVRQRLGLLLGPACLALGLMLPAPEGLSPAGWHTAAIALLMTVWWICESIPIPVTAMIPLILFPLVGAGSIGESAEPYANPIIFLFLGGFLIATAMERWSLHKRIALHIIRRAGTGPRALIGGFMIAAAFLSMWVSNTATALMILPVGLSVIQLADAGDDEAMSGRFAVVLLLAVAYGANVGGMGTLIGTPPNALLAGFVEEQYGRPISFVRWLTVGLPVVVLGLPVVFFILTKVAYPIRLPSLPGGSELIAREIAALGPMNRGERSVAVVFTATAFLWITRPLLEPVLPGLSDAGIAMAGGVSLFLIPVDLKRGIFVHDWPTTRRLPWGTLILFGGGLSLASAFTRTGLSEWIGTSLSAIASLPMVLILMIVVAVIVLLTELTSNTATTATFLPVLAALTIGIGQNPLLLAVPAVLGASCAFMLPVATPPNAIVYGSGRVTVPQMARAGLFLNLAFIVLITALAYTLILWAFDVQLGVVPEWAQ